MKTLFAMAAISVIATVSADADRNLRAFPAAEEGGAQSVEAPISQPH